MTDERDKTINEEAGLPDNWVPVDIKPIVPRSSEFAGFPIEGGSKFLQGSLPPSYQHDTSFVGTAYKQNVPQLSLMPLGPQGNPNSNAAIQSTSAQVVVQAAAAAPPVTGDVESVPVTKLSGTTYAVVDSDRGSLLSFNNPSGGTITLPSGGTGGTSQAFVQSSSNDNIGTSVSAVINGVVTGRTIIVVAMASKLDAFDYPISGVSDDKGNVYTKLSPDISFLASGSGQRQNMSIWAATGVTGGTLNVTATSAAGTFFMMTVMEYLPSLVFNFEGTPTNANGGGSLTTPSLITTGGFDLGLAIVMFQTTTVDQTATFGSGFTQRVHFFENGLIGYAFSLADKELSPAGSYSASASLTTQGNLTLATIINGTAGSVLLPPGWFAFIENTGSGTFSITSQTLIDGGASPVSIGPKQGVMVAFDGANWFTFRGTGGIAFPAGVASGGTGVTTIPAHGVVLGEGTAPIAVASPGTAGRPLASNGASADPSFQILPVAGGGTGSDLSATGGASQVLKQVSSGAAVTVGQLAAVDLSNGTTGTGAVVLAASPTLTGTVALPIATLSGKITNYNGIATVSDGVPAEYATVDLTAQSAAIGATTLYAVPASGAGMYRVSWVAKITTPATTSSVLGGTNGFQLLYTDKDDSVVVTTPAWWSGGNNGAAPTSASLNTTQTYIGGSFIVDAKASTNIQYSVDYTSVGGTAMQYNLHIKLEAL